MYQHKQRLLKILFGRCELRSFLFGASSCLWHVFPCGSILCLTLADCERSSSQVSLPLYPSSILYLFSSSLLWNALESSSFVGLSSIAQKCVSHQTGLSAFHRESCSINLLISYSTRSSTQTSDPLEVHRSVS